MKCYAVRDIWYHAAMRIVSWNVNGIRSVHAKGKLVPLIKTLKPDFLCLQETKAEEHQSEVDLPEYEEYWNSSEGRKGYSGTAIFCREKPESIYFNIPHNIAKKYDIEGDGYGNPNAEGRVVVVEHSAFHVVTVYTPNAKPDLSRLALRHKAWDPAFLAYLRELDAKKPVIVCGDFNVAHTEDDLANPKANEGEHGFTREEREGVERLIDAGFSDTFRHFTRGNGHYTWWSHFANARARNIGWRIDYFFVSKRLLPHVTKSIILPDITGSDHCPILLDIEP